MTRAGTSKNKATDEQLKEIADSIGVGANSKNKKKTMKTLTGRQRGKPIDALTRRRLAQWHCESAILRRATRTRAHRQAIKDDRCSC